MSHAADRCAGGLGVSTCVADAGVRYSDSASGGVMKLHTGPLEELKR